MRYLDKKFTVAAPDSDAYRDGWERVFGKSRSQGTDIQEECAECGGSGEHRITCKQCELESAPGCCVEDCPECGGTGYAS